ncbi:hypothetical protein CLOM_g16108 [Closterium sp. NIES-68]|nr:hypothetical protein CLOM_g16108 [Closterium sp. NIES-68]GJP58589.1 hypothetical protein CLOP_g698 [Closterium sp. NIES-67]
MLGSCDLALTGHELTAFGRTILTDVPDNVIFPPMEGPVGCSGVFLGVRFDSAKSRHVFPIGTLRNLRFLCCYRFKLWWMTQRVGSNGNEVPNETQFLLLEADRDSRSPKESVYVVMLPLVDGSFRAAIQGSSNDMLEVCSESGDPDVQTRESTKAVFVNAGRDPYKLLNESVKSLEKHSGNFQHREKKTLPGFVDYFGWCTWDAFYTDVDRDGIRKGLSSLAEGGVPARFMIIDDGWQAVAADFHGKATLTPETQHFSRLVDVKPNEKFHCDEEEESCVDGPRNLKDLVTSAKGDFGLKYVYVWHALMGYWGGVNPTAASTQKFLAAVKYPDFSPSVLDKPDTVLDLITKHGLGVIDPSKIHEFYDEMHSYLASCGVDGVKVDVQSILELVGGGHGGRVEIARAYHTALEASVAKNFKENGVIACMSHNTDSIYMTQQTAVVRASDDFWPNDPASHTIHLLAVAYNSMFLGEFMQPDWDMFHSLHPAAAFHAAARAVGGCPVYVSDKPGQHNFEVLRKLVLYDGSILRAKLPGRPTRDCLFVDTARDGQSLLKVWNSNSCNGVLGAFNCQGAGWCEDTRKYRFHESETKELAGTISASDIEGLAGLAGADWEGDVAIYSHNSGELVHLPKGASLIVVLNRLEFEIFTASPIQRAGQVECAAIGLAGMYNSGGAVLSTSTHKKALPAHSNAFYCLSTSVKGSGMFIVCFIVPSGLPYQWREDTVQL